jgi:Domain of unknown function (DUF4326)
VAKDEPIGVQRQRTKGWRMPPNTVSVCRPRLWGNPHKVGLDNCGDAQTAVMRFQQDLLDLTLKDGNGTPLLRRIKELRGKNLACFCKIGTPCHRDILLLYANDHEAPAHE